MTPRLGRISFFVAFAFLLIVAGLAVAFAPAILLPLGSTTDQPPAANAVPQRTGTPTATVTRRPTRTPTPTATLVPIPTQDVRPTATPTRPPPPSGDSDQYVGEYYSTLMGQQMPYSVYLPPGYYTNSQRYPVVYLLHGWGGDHGEWAWYGAHDIADELIRAGEVPPFIIASPEGDKAYWFNHFGGPAWGDYAALEFVDYVDSNFRTLTQRENRALGGLSMGGQGALSLALLHTDRFALVGLRSPSWRRSGDTDTPPFFGDEAYYATFDALAQLRAAAPAALIRTYVIYGSEDYWGERTREIVAELERRGMPVETHVYPGEHDGEFFKARVEEDLLFFGAHISSKP